MKNNKNCFSALAVTAVAGCVALGVGPAKAAVIATDASTPVSISGVSQFQTDGAHMVGMTVTATFGAPVGGGAFSETVVWQATGATSGAALGTNWSIRESGDTFTDLAWTVSTARDTSLISLVFDGAPGLTLFDKELPSFGTDGSAKGKDFATDLGAVVDGLITATYSVPVGIGAAAPVQDIWRVLSVDFSNAGLGSQITFSFTQDTDNDAEINVPEPGTLGLLGLGLVGMGFLRRRNTA